LDDSYAGNVVLAIVNGVFVMIVTTLFAVKILQELLFSADIVLFNVSETVLLPFESITLSISVLFLFVDSVFDSVSGTAKYI
jgi:hypothetical protein